MGNCISSFDVGFWNNSGEHLVDFRTINNFFISNKTIQHIAGRNTMGKTKVFILNIQLLVHQ